MLFCTWTFRAAARIRATRKTDLLLLRMESSASRYDGWSREQLLERIAQLEGQTATSATASPTTNTTTTDKKQKKSMKKERPFDISKYSQRHIALKVAYLGWNYMGFAAQGDEVKVPTVEGRLFQALQNCRLIVDPENCNFSRCGRTDKGVSGLGQVVSLKVRCNNPGTPEIPYLETINRLLPEDIRVLAWAPVSPDFNARFDCKSRTYKYFFCKGTLDIDAMREGASYMLGDHDFRNFCKLDPSKNITNYVRTILSLDIRPVANTQEKIGPNVDFWEVELKGTAFLWHQVRCIMSILFLVGQRLEEPTIVKDLLNIEKIPSRPDYPMASELPLLLYECEFDGIDWVYATGPTIPSPARIYQHWRDSWSASMTKTLLYQTFMRYMLPFPVTTETNLAQYLDNDSSSSRAVVLGGGKELRSAKYKKLMDRPRCDSDQVKKEKYHAKKKQKTSL